MKTKTTVFGIFLSLLAGAAFFSCDSTVALGKKLDVEGPIVTITAPSQRQSVPVQFEIEGTAWDYSGVSRLLINAVSNNVDFPRQWRFEKKAWQISDDSGATWTPLENAEWSVKKDLATWKIPVDMVIDRRLPIEGEYTFNVQAWDKGGFTDDNSFKALVLIIDLNPPKVVITNPYLYDKYGTDPDFIKFNAMADDSGDWQDPAYLGKFITQEFSLKWQIEDIDVWSIDLRFYPRETVIDDDPDTPLPNDFIYRYYENTPPPPPKGVNPEDLVKLNGAVTIPDLYSPAGTYEGGELKRPLPLKTTVKVVAVCYDAAGNPNQEKTLGYFISWPKANLPWIVFTDGLAGPEDFYGRDVKDIEEDVFTVYPSRSIKATAFQSYGVKEVKYSLYECNTQGGLLNNVDISTLKVIEKDKVVSNASGKTYSTIFPWELSVPPFTGYYIFEAQAFSTQDKPSEKYTMLFRVHDITFPDFVEGPFPAATDPLFMSIHNNKITIRGTVSDATEVVSLCMAWINPASKGYAAMSQLSYFRNNNYAGWKEVLKAAPGNKITEQKNAALYGNDYPYDPDFPNTLWNLRLTPNGMDYDTNRHLFTFEQEIDITADMNIGPLVTDASLKSQVFLFRAANPDNKCTIITYAPQGDTLAPVIDIQNVIILQSGSSTPATFLPNTFNVVPQFDDGDTITINGTWWEDSAAYLSIQEYFLNNFEITVNNQYLPKLTPANITGLNTQTGTWTITITVGSGQGQISKDKLKDTLVIGIKARDIGGNEAEAGSSWLIQSDNLRLMRISSEAEDGIYKAGDKIDIFLEFSKPVKITTTPGATKPELILSSDTGNSARAVYKDGQDNLNSRQYFEYTVATGQNTGDNYLNVKGLYYGVAYTTSTPYNAANYPFSWSRGSAAAGDNEEVRITMQPNQKGDDKSAGYYVRTLPTNSTPGNSDYQFTLTAGKHIKIDTTPPTVTTVAAASIAGHYKSGDIYITVTFSKDVTTGSTAPSLALAVTNGAANSVSTDTSNVRVNGKTITFMYTIKTGDTTNGATVSVTGFSGGILDLAGNALSGAITGALSGIYIDTLPLTDPPVVRVLSANNINNAIGTSGVSDVDIKNVYNSDLWLAVQRGDTGGGAHRLDKLEYSINNGTSWLTAANLTNTPFARPDSMTGGSYTIIARQTNKAGSVSPVSKAVKLNWDKGDFITRISSTSANGTYTNTTGNGGTRTDTVTITVTFRKQVKFTAQPSITINTTTPKNVNATGYTLNSLVTELTFSYAVGQTDNTASGQYLDVTAFNLGGTATDADGVNVNSYLTLANLPSGSRLNALKSITILTGALSVQTAATFNNSLVTGGGLASDGSYNTALVIVFNRNIVKGEGEITIIQDTANYRLPAVLTESQFNKYSSIANVNSYYTRGANGYTYTSTTDRKPDTSTKYILSYDVDTAASANAPNASGTGIPKLASDFRQAESVKLSINAGAVKIDGARLIVELTDSNALQVPGTNYLVSYPKGFVQDSLNNPCPEVTAASPVSVALGGVAKPFIRINKTQDTIETQTGSATQPRLKATQPFQANVRFDCRTPGSTIYYFVTDATTNVSAMNWTYNANPASNGPNDRNDAAPAQPSDPETVTTARQTYTAPLTIGDASGTTNAYQGFQWYGRAKANKGTSWSANSEEMAFKTVITYVINNMTNADNGIRPGDGDQIWIRGGDAIGLSSVPGFPINWDVDEFETVKAEKKRAGIRLFTNTATTTNLYTTSTWKFVTWEINVDTYFDIILGRDTDSTAAEALQYGPRQFAYQRAGWTSYKEQFRALPGKHRWLVSDNPSGTNTKGTLNFSGTFGARPQYTGANITYPPAP